MDRKTYTAKLEALRQRREEITELDKKVAAAQKALDKLAGQRDKLVGQRARQVAELAGYDKAQAAAIAKAADMGVADVVRIAPLLDPTPAAVRAATSPAPAAPAPAAPATEPTPPLLEQPQPQPQLETEPDDAAPTPAPAPEVAPPGVPVPAAVADVPQPPADEPAPPQDPTPAAPAAGPAAPVTEPAAAAPPQPQRPTAVLEMAAERVLPSIPAGPAGRAFTAVTANLVSTRPNFTQQARTTVFLDADKGDLVYRDRTARRDFAVRLDLGARTPGELLDAVLAAAPDTERIYITAGAPWLIDAERYSTLKDSVAAWLNAPSERWATDVGRGRDRLAGHFVHARQPVGRYMRAGADRNAEHVEIRSMGEWFDPAGADPALVRDAFRLLWQELRKHWSDAVLMGSPSQTGRDLWTRTIPTKGKWAGGYPVLSEELRGLLHATAGQGRTELIRAPRVPDQLPGLVEYDRTFAYAKHTWKSPVGAPRRITAAAFAGMSGDEQVKALMQCSHWHIKVTIPAGWEHVGLLPAPAPGDRNWHYPATPGATFTTWAGGAEVYTALTNPLSPWRIEILDGLVWEEGKVIDDWAKKLKTAWGTLTAMSQLHGDDHQRAAAYLASRGIRSILLYGIGAFAQRPRMVTGSTPADRPGELPDGVEILGQEGDLITWQRAAGFSRDPNAHPELAAGVWSGARAALLDMNMREDSVRVGALHVPAGSVVAFRTDAVYLTAPAGWPYHGNPGEYLLKGHLPGPVAAPATEEELLALRDEGRAALAAAGGPR
ncbi:hypothetical protein WKI65_38245 [Streptomyces sp. MS1.AVA.3]|uniref:hypothetical protein n=1 Tax=Streptomyces decoyicus TaxID=249567 RepID=UPI0030BBA23D